MSKNIFLLCDKSDVPLVSSMTRPLLNLGDPHVFCNPLALGIEMDKGFPKALVIYGSGLHKECLTKIAVAQAKKRVFPVLFVYTRREPVLPQNLLCRAIPDLAQGQLVTPAQRIVNELKDMLPIQIQ